MPVFIDKTQRHGHEYMPMPPIAPSAYHASTKEAILIFMEFRRIISLCLVGCLPAIAAVADEPVASTSHALLDQMSRETQAVYQEVQRGVVRLQLPLPRWLSEAAAKDNPIDKWGGQLAAQVREKLEMDRENIQHGKYSPIGTRITSTTQPVVTRAEPAGGQSPPWRVTQDAGNNTLVIESSGRGANSVLQIQTGGGLLDGHVASGGAPQLSVQAANAFAPNNIGLIFDDDGHVLVPLYLEKETVGDGVRASVGEGPAMTATFIASDKQTNLTILKLPATAGKALKLSAARPEEGAMVLLLAPNSTAAKLMLWTGGQRDVAGVVVRIDGSVAGFARYGQFLSAGACKPAVEQLVLNGRVKRAALGVMVREVQRNDPAREQWAALRLQPALRVEEVRPDSAAARGDLQRGDLILSVADKPVGDPASFAAVISNRAGKTAMRILRDGRIVDVSVELVPE